VKPADDRQCAWSWLGAFWGGVAGLAIGATLAGWTLDGHAGPGLLTARWIIVLEAVFLGGAFRAMAAAMSGRERSAPRAGFEPTDGRRAAK
jgi:hypothetical protein